VIDPVYYNINSLAKVLFGGIINNAMNPDHEDKPVPRHLTEWKKIEQTLSDHQSVWA
jgi:hypothetical protein